MRWTTNEGLFSDCGAFGATFFGLRPPCGGRAASGGDIFEKKKGWLVSGRVYLDWNASAPLRPEARAAVVAGLEATGNPSAVHGEGRRARALVEKARAQVAEALGAQAGDVIFTSGASEAAALALAGRDLVCADVEHPAVRSWCRVELPVDRAGAIALGAPADMAVQLANAETGVVQDLPQGLAVCDATQAFGKFAFGFDWLGCEMMLVSAHKLGGPRGVGALVVKRGIDIEALIRGGGQESGRRSGTENVAGIAGFGAAAEAAARDLADGAWDAVATLRDELEQAVLAASPDTVIAGAGARRLPNTSFFATPGWKGETQVMQMDLAGFAVSAGSACSSGKTRTSRVLRAMGYDEGLGGSAIRVSLGPTTKRDDVLRFAETWARARARHAQKAA